MDTLISDTEAKMKRTLDVIQADFSTIRTGKANNALIEDIIISAYDGTAKLKVMELATIQIQDPKTIVITPFDKSVLGDIEKGITESQTGLSAAVNGDVIRVSIPPLTEERRTEFVRMVNQKAEQGRIMVRHVRQDAMTKIKRKKDENHISEDEVSRNEKEVQKLTDDFIKSIDEAKNSKEKELMKV